MKYKWIVCLIALWFTGLCYGEIRIVESIDFGREPTEVWRLEQGRVVTIPVDTPKRPITRIVAIDEITQIQNQFWTGSPYRVTLDRGSTVVRVENLTNNQVVSFCLDRILHSVDAGNNRRELRETILRMPGEVLHDLAIHTDYIEHMEDEKNKHIKGGGFAGHFFFAARANSSIFVHELGHNIHFGSRYGDFKRAFYRELEAYVKAGGTVYDRDGNSEKWDNKLYCTANEMEMFAEAYELLMTGRCQSQVVMLKHFPESLEQVREVLRRLRSLEPNQRNFNFHKRKETTNVTR